MSLSYLAVEFEVRKDELVFDHLPDDSGHLISVQFYNRVVNFDLGFVTH